MRTITCPRCGATVSARPFYKPFCARCGWNLERAQISLDGSSSASKFVPFVILGIAILVAFGIATSHAPAMFFVPLIFGGIILIPWWASVSMRKAIGIAKESVNPSLALSQPPVDMALQRLQVLPRPRKVQIRFAKGLAIMLVAVGLLAFTGFYVAAHSAARVPNHRGGTTVTSPFLIMAVFFVILVLVPFFRDKKAMPLLRDGELALGRVTFQQNVSQGKSSYSRIGYEFKTNSGQLIQDQAKDLTFSLYEDMTIPVFYDPQNPSKNVTPCATFLRVSTEPF
jgi:uncharacterized protein (DUF983 family)